MKIYAVIMAGGVGTRFWPRSRTKTPKQLLKISSDKTMIEETIERLDGIVDKQDVFIITNIEQAESVKKILPDLPAKNVVAEPFGKNTAACIGLASVIISDMDPEAVIITLPADHLIKDAEKFRQTIKNAAEFAYKSKGLVTIGIVPTRPETGYGYIQREEKETKKGMYKVKTFAEKPNISTARRFVTAGDFLWNSGMFIWRTDVILSEIEHFMPDLHFGLEQLKESVRKPEFNETVREVYKQLKSISIDYGIMEKSQNVFVTMGEFPWSDVGSWEAVYELEEKDETGIAKTGDVYVEKSYDSYIYSPQKFTAVIGADNLIIIDTEDALLVCRRDNAQDVKHIVDYLKMNNKKELL